MARISGKSGNVYIATAEIESCEDVWNEYVDSDVVASADTSDYQVGSASAKFVCAEGLGVEIAATEAIASLDISSYTQLMFWAKCSIGLNAGDFQILLDDTPQCSSPLIEANIPALAANTWKLCRVPVVLTPATAIISVGLKQAGDRGALTIWLDDIRAAKAVAGIKSWTIDYEMETIDVTAFDSGGHRQFMPVLDVWRGSFEGFKESAPLTIGSILSAEFQESATATQAWRGEIIITGVHSETSVDGTVNYAYDFQGTLALEIPTT